MYKAATTPSSELYAIFPKKIKNRHFCVLFSEDKNVIQTICMYEDKFKFLVNLILTYLYIHICMCVCIYVNLSEQCFFILNNCAKCLSPHSFRFDSVRRERQQQVVSRSLTPVVLLLFSLLLYFRMREGAHHRKREWRAESDD